ncbi:glucosamine-6-phosphate deaminase [uncultured Selenomonas sp.]|uniref:glucosamine-6-phosphate deaminase n=1 Tax=uncultured Selenomonas sp. TaxID=159275 RepID=UPI0025EBE940|nr:glucosamine-6-phosphate deaminase [uncultured Selenomonas sp.]
MRIITTESYDELSMAAASIVAGQIYLKPASVLGLTTGSTPEGMYGKLVAVHKAIGLDFSKVTTFNLDAYLGLGADDPQSYHHFMQKHFFDYVNVKPENIHIPDGLAKDVTGECRAYDAAIRAAGGIDLQLLGIGRNAHIGFNEPDVKFEAATHKVRLDDETIQANARFFEDETAVPRYAISMGIKTIMLARRVVLLASGWEKADAVKRAVLGSVSPATPASILQLHQDATIIADSAAASLLPEKFQHGEHEI